MPHRRLGIRVGRRQRAIAVRGRQPRAGTHRDHPLWPRAIVPPTRPNDRDTSHPRLVRRTERGERFTGPVRIATTIRLAQRGTPTPSNLNGGQLWVVRGDGGQHGFQGAEELVLEPARGVLPHPQTTSPCPCSRTKLTKTVDHRRNKNADQSDPRNSEDVVPASGATPRLIEARWATSRSGLQARDRQGLVVLSLA